VVIFVSDNQVLVAVVPEKGMSLHFDQRVSGRRSVTFSIVLETFKMIELDRDD